MSQIFAGDNDVDDDDDDQLFSLLSPLEEAYEYFMVKFTGFIDGCRLCELDFIEECGV